MIAILQFDVVSLPHLHKFLEQGRLPSLVKLRERGHWFPLETPAIRWEGATYYSLYSGKGLAEHGLYYPFIWVAADQRVRPDNHYEAPEPVWDRIGNFGRRSLVIDPYEGRQARSIQGKALSGWQFRHKVTLRNWSVPRGLDRQFQRQLGRPPLLEETYGCPSAKYLMKMREKLLGAPKRVTDVTAKLLAAESFDLVWVTFNSSHIAGHWFLDPSRLPQDQFDAGMRADVDTTLGDVYSGVDEAVSQILEALPADSDIIILSASGMKPSTSRSHLLSGMLQAVLSGSGVDMKATKGAGSFLWRLRAAVPADLRATVARVLPDRLMMEIGSRLETRGVDWTKTRAFTVPGDSGYIRLNLRGRERDGIVDPEEADSLLDQIASGLRTFCDPDGAPAVKKIEFGSNYMDCGILFHRVPDLIVHWSDHLPPHEAGVSSPRFGEVASSGWGSGRTGEHGEGGWALIVPGASKLKTATKPLHILDIVPTICAVLGVPSEGLPGQPLLEANI